MRVETQEHFASLSKPLLHPNQDEFRNTEASRAIA